MKFDLIERNYSLWIVNSFSEIELDLMEDNIIYFKVNRLNWNKSNSINYASV